MRTARWWHFIHSAGLELIGFPTSGLGRKNSTDIASFFKSPLRKADAAAADIK